LDRLINDMLGYARAGHDAAGESLAVASLLRHALENSVVPAAGSDPVVLCDRSGNAQVVGNPGLLASAIGNLLDNALRVSPAGSAVRLSARRERGEGVVAVSDGGPGDRKSTRLNS